MCAPDPLRTSQVVDGNARPASIVARFRNVAPRPSPRCRLGRRRRMGVPESYRLAGCPRCRRLFAICSRCDRGHVYCGRPCSSAARRDSLRRARRRHRHSPEGRLDHRDRERERRQRRRRVGDHPSAPPPLCVSVGQEGLDGTPTSSVASHIGGFVPRCRVCGRRSRWARGGSASQRSRAVPHRPASIRT